MPSFEDTENRVLGNLLRTPLESKSLRQIAIDTKLSYVTVHKVVPDLIKRKIIKLDKKGKASLISIDFEGAPLGRLSSAILYERDVFLRKHPKIILLTRKLEEMLAGYFYCLILFGSYAQGKQRKDSDIDLLFIVPNGKDIENYKENIARALDLIPGKIHPMVISTEDFINMLNEKYTVGRAAFKQGIVLFGTEQYYGMVKHYARTWGY